MCRRSKYTRAYFGDSFDGIDTPDLAMSHISLYAYMGFGLTYRGLSTLLHKESNRVMALQKEWQNAHRNLKLNQSGALILEGGDALPEPRDVSFRVDTHGDHRIAMCMSILAAKHPIWLKQPEVVRKSFPNFWDELSKLGYQIRFNTFPVS
jgi:3-phosphoshikimate 1-carboxyvinyltransferase